MSGEDASKQRNSVDPSVPNNHGIVLAVVLLTALVLGLCAGTLSWLGGAPVAMAVLYGFAAFGGVTLFILALLRYLRSGN